MTELITSPVRAKAGYIEGTRVDKSGRVVKTRDHAVPSKGLYSGKEMEKVMRDVARDVGADESQIRIETYAKGEAPIEANPIHRGGPKRWERLPDSQAREVRPAAGYDRRVWGGFDLKEIEARAKAYQEQHGI